MPSRGISARPSPSGLTDALTLEKEFWPELNAGDLISLPNYHIYLKVMIDGVVSRPFSAETLPVVAKEQASTPSL